MGKHPDRDIQAAWTGAMPEGTRQFLHESTKQAVIVGASIALAAENLVELETQARLFAERSKPYSIYEADEERSILVEELKEKLLASLKTSPKDDPIDITLNSMVTGEELLPYRRKIGAGISQLALVCGTADTDMLAADGRVDSIREITMGAIDWTLTMNEPAWIPSRPAGRPVAGTANIPAQPERRGPSLGRLPGVGKGPGDRLPF